jgi:hypothetical protein
VNNNQGAAVTRRIDLSKCAPLSYWRHLAKPPKALAVKIGSIKPR